MLQIWLSQVLRINSNLVSLIVSCLSKFLAFCVTMRNNIFFLTFAVSNCGQHWHAYRSGCLRLFEEHKNWVAANQHCATFNTPGKGNGRLISISSQDENNRIGNLRSSEGFSLGMEPYNYNYGYNYNIFIHNIILMKITLRAMSLSGQTRL